MRKRLYAWAAGGLAAALAFKRAVLFGVALTTGAAVVGSPADVARGMAWLQAQVQTSGGLLSVSRVAAPEQAGCETAATLLTLAGANTQVAALVSALNSAAVGAITETVACGQQLRQQLGQPILEADLEERRVGQQGYTAAAGFGVSNSLDTGWALAARLQSLGAADNSSVLAWLQSIQGADGSFAAAGRADPVATAVVLRGLRDQASRSGVAAAIVTKASSWLLAQRNAQGNWLDDVALTALVFEAVHPYTAVDPGIASTVEAYLLGGQRPDGSWQSDPYVTSLALRALALTSVPPVDPTLAATASVRGVVTAAGDGRLLGGAIVTAQSGAVVKSGVSDAQGQYLLQGIAPGSITMTTSLPGYQTLSAQVSLDMGAVALFSPAMYAAGENIPTTGVIKGRVLSFGSNVPLVGVAVQATGTSQSVTTTDALGRFELAASAGAYTLTWSLSSYITQGRQVLLSGGASADVGTVLLKPERTASTLRGVVTDVQGQPVAGAAVTILGGPAAVTGPTGNYSFADLSGLQFVVRASAPGYATREFTLNLVAPGDLVQDMTLPSQTATLLSLSQAAAGPRTLGRQSDTTASARVGNASGSEGSAVASAVVTDPQGNRVATLPAVDGSGNAIGTISLLPGADRQVFFKWNTGTFSAGSYILTLRLHVPGTTTRDNPDGVVFASTQTSVDVTSSASFHGSITANPPVLRAGIGTPVKLSATIQNDGNVVLPAQGYTLSIVDTATAIAAHTQSLSSDAIAKSQLRTLTFNDWTPPAGGSFRLELTSPSTPGALVTATLYAGDPGWAAFTADKSIVPAGNQQVRGSVNVAGQDPAGTITDPLEPMIRAALVRAVAYADKKAFEHTTNDLRCYACHVQTQALVGGEHNLKFTQPADALRRAMLVSQITQNIDARGAINNTKVISLSDGASLSTVPTSVANTSLGLWGLTAWHDPASVAMTRVRTAGFLAGAQRDDGSWWPDNPASPDNGWWRTPAPLTAINLESLAALKTHLKTSAAPRKRAFKPFTAQGLTLASGSEVRVNADSDGTLYLASWPQRKAWKVSDGVATEIATGKIWNARPLGEGRVLLATDDGVRIREADGTIKTLAPVKAFDAKPWGDKFLVTSEGAIHSLDPSGTMVSLISDPVLMNSSTEVVVQADGSFLVSTYYGRQVARFSASGQYVDTPILLDEWEDWGLWLVPYGDGYLVGSEKGLFHYNKDWVAERWSNTRTVSAAPLPDGRVIAYMGTYPGGLYEITDDGPIDVASTSNLLDASIGKAATWLNASPDTSNNIDHAFRLIGMAAARKHYEGTSRAAEFDAAMQAIGLTLRSRQQVDGGWVWKQNFHTTSDSMVTAMVGLALDTLSPSRDAPEVRKAIELLLGRQREDGSWLTENEVVTQWRIVDGVRTLDTNLVLVPSTWVEIWLPTVLDRVGRIDTDLSITFAPNAVMSNPDPTPTSVTPMADGAQMYVWKLTAWPAAGAQVGFDVELKDMQVDETRPVARAAQLVSRNTFVAGSVTLAVEVPKVTVGTSLTPSANTDKPSYTASDQALFTAAASNGGAEAREVQVRFSVLDATGQVVDVLPLGARVTVPASGTTSIAALWPAAGLLSGSYQLKADLISPTGSAYGTATASFAVTASTEQASSARIGTDRLSYDASQTVQLASRIANLTANAPQEDVRAVTTVRGASGQEVFNRTESIAQLAAGNQLQYHYAIAASGLNVGPYLANLQLLNSGGAVLSQASASFAVVGTDQNGVGLTGQLQAMPSVAPIGRAVTLRLAASNNGNAGVSGTVKVRVLEPQSGTVLGSFNQEVMAWSPGATQNFEWAWTAQGLDGQTLVAAASAAVNGHEVSLGQAVIRLVGVPQLRAQPAELSFTPIYVGESATRTLSLASVGTTAATSLTFSLGGADPTQYVITQDGCTIAASIPIGATCTAVVSYRPHTVGNHVSELRVAHANGEPVAVPLLGQAKPVLFTGTVGTDPRELEAGESVSLNYSVSNPASSAARMTGKLNLLRSNGQSLATWPLDVNAGPLATIAGNQPYSTGAEGQTLTVALSQLLGSSSFVLATTTFTVVDPPVPLEVSSALKPAARILVLVSCPPGQGTQEDAACVAQRSQSIVAYLGGLGLASKAVTTGEAFLAEMRCGSYNTYWISGGAVKLDAQSVAELREAVYRGEALWMDGVHDSRNQLLHPAAGVKELGKLPASNQTARLAADGVYGLQALPTLGQPGKFELVAGQSQGLFMQVPGEQSPLPAVVSNKYGQGRSLLFAFDMAAMVSADTAQSQGQLAAFVTASASYSAAGSPTLTVGDITGLSTSVTSQGTRTVEFRAEATVPTGLTITAVVPQSTVVTDTSGTSTVTWVFSLSGGSTRELGLQLRALQPGAYGVPLVIYSLPAAGSALPPRARYSGTFPLDVRDAANLLHQALEQVMTVQPTAAPDKSAHTKAMDAVRTALSLHNQGSYEQALTQWVAAAEALATITSADTATVRTAISLAMEATTDALCLQRCGSAACQ